MLIIFSLIVEDIPIVNLENVTLIGNANGAGGGIFMYSGSLLYANNLKCQSNTVTGNGGCLAVSQSQSNNVKLNGNN